MSRKPMPIPADVSPDPSSRTLRITWSDGHESRYAYRLLRQRCPCAHCVDEWTGEGRLDPARVPADITPREVSRVGAYALRFTWSDGHGTGIYTYALLRAICECEACAAGRGEVKAPQDPGSS